MGIFSRLFGASKYNDAQLASQAMAAVTTDPMVSDPGAVVVTSKNGVLTVSGTVTKMQEKARVEDVIRSALETRSLKHERIVNELRLPKETL